MHFSVRSHMILILCSVCSVHHSFHRFYFNPFVAFLLLLLLLLLFYFSHAKVVRLKIRIAARAAGDVQHWNVIPFCFLTQTPANSLRKQSWCWIFESQCFTIVCYSFVAQFCFSLWNFIPYFFCFVLYRFLCRRPFFCLLCRHGQWNSFVFWK